MTYATSADYLDEMPQMPISDARKILRNHSLDWSEFIEEFGECESYDTQEVFGWMGY